MLASRVYLKAGQQPTRVYIIVEGRLLLLSIQRTFFFFKKRYFTALKKIIVYGLTQKAGEVKKNVVLLCKTLFYNSLQSNKIKSNQPSTRFFFFSLSCLCFSIVAFVNFH
jgi:hypothetical protein